MPRKRCAGKDESEPSLSIGDVSHHAVDPGVGASDKRLLRQPNPRIVKDPLAVVLIRRNNVDRIHPLRGIGRSGWNCNRVWNLRDPGATKKKISFGANLRRGVGVTGHVSLGF